MTASSDRTNAFRIPMAVADDAVLDMLEHEVLGDLFIEELLLMVDRGNRTIGRNSAPTATG